MQNEQTTIGGYKPCIQPGFHAWLDGFGKAARSGLIRNVTDLERSIKEMNGSITNSFHPDLFSQIPGFFESSLCQIVEAASVLSQNAEDVPCLPIVNVQSLGIDRSYAAGLLACAFLCGFRNTEQNGSPSITINFDSLYASSGSSRDEILRFYVHYFERIHAAGANGFISFHRVSLEDKKLASIFPDLEAASDVVTEDACNHKLGEGPTFILPLSGSFVLPELGRASEANRFFLLFPELLLLFVICPNVEAGEAVLIRGCKRFSKHRESDGRITWINECRPNVTTSAIVCVSTFIIVKSCSASATMMNVAKPAANEMLTSLIERHVQRARSATGSRKDYSDASRELRAQFLMLSVPQHQMDICKCVRLNNCLVNDVAELHCLVEMRSITSGQLKTIINVLLDRLAKGDYLMQSPFSICKAIKGLHDTIFLNIGTYGKELIPVDPTLGNGAS